MKKLNQLQLFIAIDVEALQNHSKSFNEAITVTGDEISSLLIESKTVAKKSLKLTTDKTSNLNKHISRKTLEGFEDFELSNRAINCLVKNEIKTPLQLKSMSNRDIRKIKNAGRKVFDEFSNVIGRNLYQVTGKRGRPPILNKQNETVISKKTSIAKESVIDSIKLMSLEFAKFGFSTRTLNQLSNNNILEISDLNSLDPHEISGWKSAGRKVMEEIVGYQGKNINDYLKQTNPSQGRGRPKASITTLGLKGRTITALGKNGVSYASDLKTKTLNDLQSMKGLGIRAIKDIESHVDLKSKERKISLAKLNISKRALNVLMSNGIKFASDIRSKTHEEIASLKGISSKSVNDVYEAIDKVA
jgi:DNA-directed RNA polymerase alpha subunit